VSAGSRFLYYDFTHTPVAVNIGKLMSFGIQGYFVMVSSRNLRYNIALRGVKLSTQLHVVPRSRVVELYLHSSICLHGIVLKNN
jgi:hypothetical protein